MSIENEKESHIHEKVSCFKIFEVSCLFVLTMIVPASPKDGAFDRVGMVWETARLNGVQMPATVEDQTKAFDKGMASKALSGSPPGERCIELTRLVASPTEFI